MGRRAVSLSLPMMPSSTSVSCSRGAYLRWTRTTCKSRDDSRRVGSRGGSRLLRQARRRSLRTNWGGLTWCTEAAVERIPPFRNCIPTEFESQPFLAGLAVAARQCAIAQEPVDRRGQRRWFTRRYQNAGLVVCHDIDNTAHAARDHRHAVMHCLEQHNAEAFRIAAGIDRRGQHEDVGGLIRPPQVRIGELASKHDAARDTEAARHALEAGAPHAITPAFQASPP